MNIHHYRPAMLLAMLCVAHATTLPCLADDTPVTVPISIGEAWQMAKANHLPLLMKDKETDMARANLKQEGLWENPEVSITHNVNNPVTHHYFEMGREGETDIQLSQRIYVGGQRRERVRKAKAELCRTEHERNDVARLLRRDLCSTMVTLASMQAKDSVVQKEITSAQKILKAYEQQQEKGNVAQAEVMRIRSLYMQLVQERASLHNDMQEQQQQLRLMMGEAAGNGTVLSPRIDYEASVATLTGASSESLTRQLEARADMLASRQEVAAAEHEVRLQKANALPELSVTGEWDKNGNIGHNFFDLGVTLTLPLLNRNQGGRKAAQAALDAKRMQQEWNMRQATTEVDKAWSRLNTCRQVALEADRCLEADNERMMEQMEAQYMKRNISLLELLDYYQAYKENHYLAIESRRDVLLAMAALDMDIK